MFELLLEGLLLGWGRPVMLAAALDTGMDVSDVTDVTDVVDVLESSFGVYD